MNQDINKSLVSKRYDAYSSDYRSHCQKMGASMDTIVGNILNPYIVKGTSLLDVAGGDGLSTSLLDTSKVTITITDISQGMLDAAKTKRPNVVDTVLSDFDNNIPFEDNTFDYSTCISALEFAKNLHATLSEIFRVTKSDGVILFTIDRFDETSLMQNERIHIHDPNGFFSKRYTTNEVKEIVTVLGGETIHHSLHNAYQLKKSWIQYDYFLVRKSFV